MRIPFTIPGVSDISEVEGFLYIEDDLLVFEFATLMLGTFRQESRYVKAERGVIDHIEAERRIFFDRLKVLTTSVQLLREIPGKHATAVVLRTKKKHREDVARFVDYVHAWIDGVPPHGPVRPAGTA